MILIIKDLISSVYTDFCIDLNICESFALKRAIRKRVKFTAMEKHRVTTNEFDVLDAPEGVKVHVVSSTEEMKELQKTLQAEVDAEAQLEKEAAKKKADEEIAQRTYNEKFAGFNLFHTYSNTIAPKTHSGYEEFQLHDLCDLARRASIRNMPRDDALACIDGVIDAVIEFCTKVQEKLGEDLSDIFAQAFFNIIGREHDHPSRLHIRLSDSRGYIQIRDLISVLRIIKIRATSALRTTARNQSVRKGTGKTATWSVPATVQAKIDSVNPLLDDLDSAIETADNQLAELIEALKSRRSTRAPGPAHKRKPKVPTLKRMSSTEFPALSSTADQKDEEGKDVADDSVAVVESSLVEERVELPPPPPPLRRSEHVNAPPPEMLGMTSQFYSPPEMLDMSQCMIQMTPMGPIQVIPVGYTPTMIIGPYGPQQVLMRNDLVIF